VNEIRFPLGLSLVGHAVCLALLITLLPAKIPPPPIPPISGGIEVVFAPSPKPDEPPAQTQTLPPQVEIPPPQPEPPLPEPAPPEPAPPEPSVAATEPPPPEPAPPEPSVAATEPPPPELQPQPVEPPPPAVEAPAPATVAPPSPAPRKLAVKPPPKPIHARPEKLQPSFAAAPAQSSPAAAAPPQTAYAPTPAPAPVLSPEVSRNYLALLSAWLESHKRYPDAARQRGEEGRAVLRFTVERGGRVVDFAVAQSSGYSDLDASMEDMMRGAVLPSFPAGMTQPRIDVSVTIRFSLAR
jgi:protein TonB